MTTVERGKALLVIGMIITCTVVVSGCTTTAKSFFYPFYAPQVVSQGARELFETEGERKIFLINALAPPGTDPRNLPNNWNVQVEKKDEQKLEAALQAAYNSFEEITEPTAKLRRNGIQAQLIARSARLCGEFTTFLKQFESETGFAAGALATTLSGLATVFTGQATVRALAGMSTVTSGVGARFQEKFFSKATEVIAKGIEARRERFRREIEKNKDVELTLYTVQQAIGDADAYHSLCNTVVGLQEAQEAVAERAKTTEQFTLKVTPIGQGSVKSEPTGINCGNGGKDCEKKYPEGTRVKLTATHATGYKFKGWIGDCQGESATFELTMDSYKSCIPRFEK